MRECFSKSVVLGTANNPLVAKPYCEPTDISENSISRVTACLCETDFCNAYRSDGEKTRPRASQQSSVSQSNRRQQEKESKAHRNRESESPSRNSKNREPNTPRNREIEETPRSPKKPSKPTTKQEYHPDKAGLQCFSCGSLLNPDAKCDEFSPTNISMTQTCLKGESCLMYTWKKSSSETGMS